MVAPVPIRLSDFFGNLSVSGSPFGWSAWFIFFASLAYRDQASFFNWMYGASSISLAFLIWRSATDTVEQVDESSLKSELRFVAGTGIGGTLLALAGSLDGAQFDLSTAAVITMSAIMLVFFALMVLVKKKPNGAVFNFTQSYLIVAACFGGCAFYWVRRSTNAAADQAAIQLGHFDALAFMFATGWALALAIMFFRFFSLGTNSRQDEYSAG